MGRENIFVKIRLDEKSEEEEEQKKKMEKKLILGELRVDERQYGELIDLDWVVSLVKRMKEAFLEFMPDEVKHLEPSQLLGPQGVPQLLELLNSMEFPTIMESSRYKPPDDEKIKEPLHFSIGPIHHGKPHLQLVEVHKLVHLYAISIAGAQHGRYLIDGLILMKKLEKKTRGYYADKSDLGSNEFSEMMMLDGLLLIQFINIIGGNSKLEFRNSYMPAFIRNSFSYHGLFHDLVLLNNQLPLSIVWEICRFWGIPNDSYMKACVSFFAKHLPGDYQYPPEDAARLIKPENILHFLHLFRSLLIRTREETTFSVTTGPPESILNPILIPSATKLVEAGVKLKASSTTTLLDVTFDNRVLVIPTLHINIGTNCILRDLLTLEVIRPDIGTDITSYSMFLSSLIRSQKDVDLLREEGILDTGFSHNGPVKFYFFNEIILHETYNPAEDYLAPVIKDVNEYCGSRRSKWRAKLVRDYCGNPWMITSVVAATVLLVLTIIQTVFSILSYNG